MDCYKSYRKLRKVQKADLNINTYSNIGKADPVAEWLA